MEPMTAIVRSALDRVREQEISGKAPRTPFHRFRALALELHTAEEQTPDVPVQVTNTISRLVFFIHQVINDDRKPV